MRIRAWNCVALLAWPRVALAEPGGEYPVEYIDRPLMLFDGMTEVGGEVNLGNRIYTTTDANGNSTDMVTRTIVDLHGSARHQFGSFELYVSALGTVRDDIVRDYTSVYARGRVALGSLRRAVSLDVSYLPPQQTLHYGYSFGGLFEAKARAPKRAFALYWYVGADAQERSRAIGSSDRVELGGGGTAELQLAHRLALYVGLGLRIPVHHSGEFNGDLQWTGPPLGLEINFDQFDVWVDLTGLGFVTVQGNTRFVWGTALGARIRFGE